MLMNTALWKKFQYKDLFKIYTFKGDNILNSQEGGIPYVSSSEDNNGVSAYVESTSFVDGNKITVARNGSVCSAFYQSKDFCASPDDIRIYELKNHTLTPSIGLFLCTLIEKEKYRYAYGRKFGTKRMKEQTIKLPVTPEGKPDWDAIEAFVNELSATRLSAKARNVWKGTHTPKPKASPVSLSDTHVWKWFHYHEIFDIRKGFYNKKPEDSSGSSHPFIGATDANNGITAHYALKDIEEASKTGNAPNQSIEQKVFEGNCLTVSNNGSVGYAFYQDKPFTCSHDVNPLYLKEGKLNKYIAMFLTVLIEKERFRWAYGRKWRPKRMPASKIKLPVTADGKPDWDYMENYIKGLPYSSYL